MHNFERYAFYLMLIGLALCMLGYCGAVLAGFRTRVAWGVSLLIFPPAVIPFFLTNARRVVGPSLLLGTGGILIAAPFAANALSPFFVDLGPLENRVNGELHLTLTGWNRAPEEYVAVLRARPQTVVLQMANADVDDPVLKTVASLKNLRELDLNGAQVTDVGLAELASLPSLQILRLRDTKITDEGFQTHLFPLENLKELDLRGTGVSSAALRTWKAAKSGRKELH
jgi:hypothetical protein